MQSIIEVNPTQMDIIERSIKGLTEIELKIVSPKEFKDAVKDYLK